MALFQNSKNASFCKILFLEGGDSGQNHDSDKPTNPELNSNDKENEGDTPIPSRPPQRQKTQRRTAVDYGLGKENQTLIDIHKLLLNNRTHEVGPYINTKK